MAYVRFSVLLATVNGLALGPRLARACDPVEGFYDSIPTSGSPLPANGIILLRGGSFGLDDVELRVNGDLVEFEETDALGSLWFERGIRPLNPPAPGDELVLTGTGCFSPGCELQTYSFQVVEADDEDPASVDDLSFDAWQHELSEVDSCGDGGHSYTYWVRFTAPSDSGATGLVRTWVEAFDPADAGDPITSDYRDTPDLMGATVVPLGVAAESVTDPFEEAICVRVRRVDVAGNTDPNPPEICAPCRARRDPQEPYRNEEPPWTDADLYPGGACDGGPGTTGTTTDSGGGSDSGPGGSDGTNSGSGSGSDSGTSDSESDSGEGPGATNTDRGCTCRTDVHPTGPTLTWCAALLPLVFRRRR